MMQPTLIILAAGMGSRFGGLKQMEPVGPSGETIMDYSVYDAHKAGFGKVVFVIKKEMEQNFRQQLCKRFEKKIETDLAFQEPDKLPRGFRLPQNRIKPWGTGHAVLAAENVVSTPFVVINADDFYSRDAFTSMYTFFEKDASDSVYSMIGYQLENTLSEHGKVSRAICTLDHNNYLKSATERTHIIRENGKIVYHEERETGQLSGDALVSMNIWGFTPSVFNHLKTAFRKFLEQNIDNPDAEFFTPAVVDELIKNETVRVKVLSCSARWFGITYKEDRETVKAKILEMIQSGLYPETLWK